MVETDGPPLTEPAEPRLKAPAGVAAILAALVASLPVFLFDELEVASGRLFGDGPAAFLGVVAVFAAAWFAGGSPILAALSARPAREGLWAGGLVALAMLWFLLGDSPPSNEVALRLFIWVPFASLAVGCGAAAGLLAQRIRGASPAGGRAAAFAAIGAMVAFLAVASVFLGPPVGVLTVGALVLVLLLAGGAVAWLATARRKEAA